MSFSDISSELFETFFFHFQANRKIFVKNVFPSLSFRVFQGSTEQTTFKNQSIIKVEVVNAV